MKKTIAFVLMICMLLSMPAFAAANAPPFVGNWKIYSMEGDMPVPHEQLTGTFMDNIAATLSADGKLSVSMFGEVIEGMDVVDKIQQVPTGRNDRPLKDVVIEKAEVVEN